MGVGRVGVGLVGDGLVGRVGEGIVGAVGEVGWVGLSTPLEYMGRPKTGTIKPGCRKAVARHAATIGCAPNVAQLAGVRAGLR